MANSRTNNTVKNTIAALCEQGVYTLMCFICRTVFVYTLGKTYLGFSGLFGDILTLLSLAELGVGTAILYSMYKPMAQQDYRQVSALLNLYRRVYHTIGIIVTIVGLCLTPFLDFFISDIPDMSEIPIIYILYLSNTAASYFFIYKKSILIADQKSRISSLIYIITTTAQNLFQMVFLLIAHNFIVYLSIQLVATLINNIAVSIYVDKHYTYLKEYKNERVGKETKGVIITNVKAMFLSKISSAVVTSTDNILISKFVSTVLLGVYSNYTLFVTTIRTVVSKIFEALTGSIGNLVVSESKEHVYRTFRNIWFLNYWLVAFCSASLYALMNPFIQLWVGETYLLDEWIVLIVCLNLYMRLIRNTFLTFNDAYGHFVQLRFKCVVEAIINLVVSLILVLPLNMGIFGVLLGTFISNITTNFWYEPYLLFKKKFGVGMHVYFGVFLKYFVVMAISAGAMYLICDVLIVWNNWAAIILKLVICCVFINLFYAIIYGRTREFAYLKNVLDDKVISKFLRKCKKQ